MDQRGMSPEETARLVNGTASPEERARAAQIAAEYLARQFPDWWRPAVESLADAIDRGSVV